MELKNRTFQQELVWDRLHEGLKKVENANDALEGKATKLLAGSTAIISAIVGSHLFPEFTKAISKPEAIALFLLCLTVLVMCWFAASLWGPQPTSATTSSDVMVLYREYIAKPEDVAYNNALIDSAKAFEHATWVNREKGKQLRHMFIVLQGQVVVLGIAVLLKVFC